MSKFIIIHSYAQGLFKSIALKIYSQKYISRFEKKIK